MRLNRLQLIKFGKFTDVLVDLPAARQDFHVIVGANEAGKSTVRSAIADLLFGIPTRSVHGFMHPMNALRLGASISNETAHLDFQRIKATRQTLRSPADAVLADATLIPFLGSVDRRFFEQMFALDHTRLIEGGNNILSAEDSVGQILYQSAAGVAGLGRIRDAYAEEGERIWSARYGKDREYYIAADALKIAETALKEATVRTKSWTDANDKVDALSEAISAEIVTRRAVQLRRNVIERIRRVAPFCAQLSNCEMQLEALGQVTVLPVDATTMLTNAERELAEANQVALLRDEEVERYSEALAAVQIDHAILAQGQQVEALHQQRQLYANHARDLVRRQAEVDLLWQDIVHAATQLSWTCKTEEDLRQRVPSRLLRREMDQQMREYGALLQAVQASRQALRAKSDEMAFLHSQLDEISITPLTPALPLALAAARAFGDPQLVLKGHEARAVAAEDALALALSALGKWCANAQEASRFQPPDAQTVARLLQERQALEFELKAADRQYAERLADDERISLAIIQFTALHHPVTDDDVARARSTRNALWETFAQGESSLASSARPFEAAMQHADTMSDRRLDNVEEAAELQSLAHERERAQLKLTQAQGQALAAKNAIAAFDEYWQSLCHVIGVQGMPLDMMTGWMHSLHHAIACAATVRDVNGVLVRARQALHDVAAELAFALGDIGVMIASDAVLGALCAQAEATLSSHDRNRERHATLTQQARAAQAILTQLEAASEAAVLQMAQWHSRWSTTLQRADLPPQSTTGSVQGAIEIIETIEGKLDQIRAIRVERIDTMNDDLAQFSVAARQLAQQLAPSLSKQPPERISEALSGRLVPAQQARSESARLTEMLRRAQLEAEKAHEAMHKASAILRPLLERAGVNTIASLSHCIARSDRHRALQAEFDAAQSDLLRAGDGLDRAIIEAEVNGADLHRVTIDLEQIDADLSAAINKQATLSAELATAQQTLAAIEGSADAAEAEAKRQEALAQMTDASERYIKVATAARLLRWSIERYREQKQGPMLTRAADLFGKLTLGSFQRLLVDFDKVPLALEGQRSDEVLVGVSGMSDGTRDQLYLALRLAALELHLEHATALPFIADDLFINFDDARAAAGVQALASLSQKTQVIFLTHHDHLIPTIKAVFGVDVNVIYLG